jgi:hypothetical protein
VRERFRVVSRYSQFPRMLGAVTPVRETIGHISSPNIQNIKQHRPQAMRAAGSAAAVQASKPGCITPAHRPAFWPHSSHYYRQTLQSTSYNTIVDSYINISSWPLSERRLAAACRVQAAKPTTVLEQQPMLSHLVTNTTTGPWETLAWKVC